jgi:hypothetical protein
MSNCKKIVKLYTCIYVLSCETYGNHGNLWYMISRSLEEFKIKSNSIWFQVLVLVKDFWTWTSSSNNDNFSKYQNEDSFKLKNWYIFFWEIITYYHIQNSFAM